MLGHVMMLVIQSGVCPETDKRMWPKIILDAHRKGYLYTNQDMTTAVLAYRVPKWEPHWQDEMPLIESGDILVIGWAVSRNHNRLGLLKMLRSYLKENEVREIVYYKGSPSDDLRRIICGKKEQVA